MRQRMETGRLGRRVADNTHNEEENKNTTKKEGGKKEAEHKAKSSCEGKSKNATKGKEVGAKENSECKDGSKSSKAHWQGDPLF